jgi:hypothetical protein
MSVAMRTTLQSCSIDGGLERPVHHNTPAWQSVDDPGVGSWQAAVTLRHGSLVSLGPGAGPSDLSPC